MPDIPLAVGTLLKSSFECYCTPLLRLFCCPLFRADQVVLAGADTGGTKKNVGLLCRGERLLRRVAHVAAPEYGARSQQGRLLLGQEHFCSVDASPATVSGVEVAQLWLTGGGVLGFSDDGDLEMVGPSGKRVWSLAQVLSGEQTNHKEDCNNNDKSQLNEKHTSTQHKTANIENRKLERAEEFKLRKNQRHDNAWKKREEMKLQKRAMREEIKRQKQVRREEIKQQQRASKTNSPEWNDGKANDAGSDIASPLSEATLPRQNIFVRVWSWARQTSPAGGGGQSG